MAEEELDPLQPTSDRLSRRTFVGVSAAAATVVAGPPGVQAQQPPLGRPHPPLAPEGSPLTPDSYVELSVADGSIPAYTASPGETPAANRPGVVVVMHIWGVDTSIRDVVRRLALAGFNAIAPDLYGRFGAPSGDGATDYTVFRPYSQRLERAQYAGDIRAAAKWLAGRAPGMKVGIVGFCMGGRITLLQTIDNANVFAAACPFYGPLNDVDPARVAVPVCGSYGARDTSIPADQVRAFWAALKVPNDLKIYDNAGHAFFDDQRERYVAAAAEDAWSRTLHFLQTYLRPSGQ